MATTTTSIETFNFQNRLRTLIASGNTNQAITELLEWCDFNHSGWKHEALMISSDFKRNGRDEIKGIMTINQSQIAISRINDRLLQLIERLNEKPPSAVFNLFIKHWGKLVAFTITIIGIWGGFAKEMGYDFHNFFEAEKPDTPTSTLRPATQPTTTIGASGDQSPAVNAPNSEVIINYGDSDPNQKSAKKDSVSKK